LLLAKAFLTLGKIAVGGGNDGAGPIAGKDTSQCRQRHAGRFFQRDENNVEPARLLPLNPGSKRP
jgi:hypothetical protein